MKSCVLVFMLLAWPHVVWGQTTALFLDSQPGDPIGRGLRQLITTADAEFSAERNFPQAIRIRAAGPSFKFWWDLQVCAPAAGFQPVSGAYESARRFAFRCDFNGLNFSGLDVGGFASGCNVLTGRYVVREAVYGEDGTVRRFAADFEQHCEDADVAMFGAVRYNSTIVDTTPFGGDYPRRRLTISPPSHGRVTAAGLQCGGGGTACVAEVATATTMSLTATADPGYIFGGWTGDCSRAAVTTVRINSPRSCAALFLPAVPDAPRTMAVFNSGPADLLTRGLDDVFSSANSHWTLSPTGVVAPRQVAIDITAPGPDWQRQWTVLLSAPFGEETLQAGRQYATGGTVGPGRALFGLTTNSLTCSTSTGGMTVHEWAPAGSVIPQRFAVDFWYECLGRVLTGILAYESTQSFPGAAIDRTSLAFGAAMNTTGMLVHTPDQTVKLAVSGATGVPWVAQWDQPWLTVTPDFGTDGATIAIGVTSAAGLPIIGRVVGHVDILPLGTSTIAGSITVSLDLHQEGTTAAPVGALDTPAENATVQGSIAVTGWALDDLAIDRVEIWRDVQPGETTVPFAAGALDPRTGKVFIAVATPVEGARPDVEQRYANLPAASRAGWGYLLLTHGLWNQGNGSFNLYAFAVDREGNIATLGRKTIAVDNANGTKPFGSIDTPGIGAAVSGSVVNFGWALTPKVSGTATCKIPANGVQVSIDSGPLQPVVYGGARSDIAGAFAGFSNSAAAGGHFILDTTQYANGLHTIGWLITDDCNRADGVGSRFFTVLNTGSSVTASTRIAASGMQVRVADRGRDSGEAVTVAHGYGELPEIVPPDATGLRLARVNQGDRIELRVPRGFDEAYQVMNGLRRDLPAGSTWDSPSGIFYWQPAAAFLGSYELIFTRQGEQVRVRIVVGPSRN